MIHIKKYNTYLLQTLLKKSYTEGDIALLLSYANYVTFLDWIDGEEYYGVKDLDIHDIFRI